MNESPKRYLLYNCQSLCENFSDNLAGLSGLRMILGPELEGSRVQCRGRWGLVQQGRNGGHPPPVQWRGPDDRFSARLLSKWSVGQQSNINGLTPASPPTTHPRCRRPHQGSSANPQTLFASPPAPGPPTLWRASELRNQGIRNLGVWN